MSVSKGSVLGVCLLAWAFAAFSPGRALASDAQKGMFKKVFIVVLENEDNAVARDEEYLGSLLSRGAYLSNFHGVVHPSQGNYFALTAGDNLGMSGIFGDFSVTKDTTSVADLLENAGLTWKTYAEDYPGNCFKKDSGKYARKHEPFISFKNIQANPSRCAKIVNADQLKADLAEGTIPNYSFYVPNLDHDGHDTSVRFASEWLKQTFDPLLADHRFTDDTLFVVTFDESETTTAGNPIYTVLLGNSVVPGSTVAANYDHYSLLRTIEDVLGLGTLGRNDSKATAISGVWR